MLFLFFMSRTLSGVCSQPHVITSRANLNVRYYGLFWLALDKVDNARSNCASAYRNYSMSKRRVTYYYDGTPSSDPLSHLLRTDHW